MFTCKYNLKALTPPERRQRERIAWVYRTVVRIYASSHFNDDAHVVSITTRQLASRFVTHDLCMACECLCELKRDMNVIIARKMAAGQ